MTLWVVVADGSRGKIYVQEQVDSELVEKQDIVHPDSRLHDRDLTSDRAGSDGGAVGQGPHVMDTRTEAHKHELATFAREINQQLEAGRSQNAFDRLVLMAPPTFLGMLRSSMKDEVKKRVVGELDKELVKQSAREIQDHLKQALS